MIFEKALPERDALRRAIDQHYFADETECVRALLSQLDLDPAANQRIQSTARRLVEAVRARSKGGLDAFLHEYGLSSQEGVALMCIAEALLRIPDDERQLAAAGLVGRDRADTIVVAVSDEPAQISGKTVGLGSQLVNPRCGEDFQ